MLLNPTTEIALLKLFNGQATPRDLETITAFHHQLHVRSNTRAAFDRHALGAGFNQDPRR